MSNKYDELDHAIEDLLVDRRPRGFDAEVPEDVDLLKAAALFKAARPGIDAPDPAFVQRLAGRLREGSGGRQTSSPARRRMLLGGLATAAAGLLAGIGFDRLMRRTDAPALPPRPDPELVGNLGRWFQVAHVDQVPPGAVLRVRAGAVDGFIMHKEGNLVAMSAICTHMACVLSWRQEEDDLICPCHGSTFYTDGTTKKARTPYKPLPPLRVKVENEKIFLWAVDDLTPPALS